MKPFIKWAGGKSKLLPVLLKELPINYITYIEPFIGGGALFFAIQPVKAVISDLNYELINTYEAIRSDSNNLFRLFFELKLLQNTKEDFYKIRSLNPAILNIFQRAARFIYLNKTCFNGLYRENSKGQFNVPFGNYVNPNIINENNIYLIWEYLNCNSIEIYCKDYKEILQKAQKGDLIYLDPPYHIINKTSFTKYLYKDFREQNQIELLQEFKRLDKLGCYIMLSNSNTEFITDLYKEFNKIELTTNRSINSKGEGRKNAGHELLIKNY